jgi:hypothetical protein
MINITITEKLWDGVRPASVKKTNLSEAIRTFAKANKGAPDKAKEFDDLIEAVVALGKAIDVAAKAVAPAKDDKKGAAAKLKAWNTECDKAAEQLEKDKYQLGLMKASTEADTKLKELAQTVEDAIKTAGELIRDIPAGKITDNKKIAQALQDLRSAMRDGLKATQKDGFCDFIRTYQPVLDYKIKVADVPMPPNAKAIKARLPVLEEAAEKARIEAEKVMIEGAKDRDGDGAELAKPMVVEYRKLAANIKAFIAPAKKFSADVKTIGDKFKALIGKGATHDKLLPVLQQTHDKIMAADEKATTECARGRIAKGDVQAKKIKIRETLDKKSKAFQDFEAICNEEWNLIMVIYREVSEHIAVAHRQMERVLRLVGETSEEARQAAEEMGKKFDQDVSELKNKFLK